MFPKCYSVSFCIDKEHILKVEKSNLYKKPPLFFMNSFFHGSRHLLKKKEITITFKTISDKINVPELFKILLFRTFT